MNDLTDHLPNFLVFNDFASLPSNIKMYDKIMFLFSSCCCLHWVFKFSNFSSIFSIFLLVNRLRAGELSEPLGFLVSSPYNFSYE